MKLPRWLAQIDRALLAAMAFILLLLVAGALYDSNFLSLDYLLQQLQVAAFLGVIATGVMLVVLLGHIDLSIPWVVTIGGMMSTAAAGHEGVVGSLAIPFAVVCGLAIGILNGIGVAYLRVPSMIFTLATNAIAQGLMIVHTSGFAPQDHATPAMHFLAVERSILGIPNAVWVWAAIGAVAVIGLRRTTFGRRVYAIARCSCRAAMCGASWSRASRSPAGARRSPASCLRVTRPRPTRRWAIHTCCRRSRRSCSAAPASSAAAAATWARSPAWC
jgi:ribose transport system permease protein